MACALGYSINVSGDCNNVSLGGFTLNINGEAPDYVIQWLSPYTTTIPLGVGVTDYTENSLSAGTYTFNVIDSCVPNNVLLVNFYISSGTCVSITNTQDTLCGSSNGALTATTSNLYDIASFYLYDNVNGYITSGTSSQNFYTFPNLSASTYYVIADDGAGCTGKTESCIIKSSSTFDYGLYTIDDAGCTTQSGKIYVTGLTGNPPYTYLWSNSQTDSYLTGLTAGSYSVTITDNTGCAVSKSVNLVSVIPVSIGSLLATPPTCFSSDGEVTALIVNGTPPYYYSGSNGSVHISFSTSYTFTGLGPGVFSVQVTDAGLCTSSSSVTLLTPNGFSLVNVGIVNSNCNNIGGKLSPISLLGGSGNYVYTLTYPNGDVVSQPTTSASWGFENLSSGTYTLNITDGVCSYTNQYTITNQVLYDLTVTTTGTTNNLPNGSVNLSITTGGTAPYQYLIQGGSTNLSVNTSLSSYTFNNLISGVYTAKVTDSNSCPQQQTFLIDASHGIDFILIGYDPTNGTNGSLEILITDGNPPYTIEWLGVLSAQTGYFVTNLSPGTYCVKITDSTGGVKQICKTLDGYTLISGTQYTNICDNTFVNTGDNIQKGIKQMFFEGFYDLTIGDTNCILNQAIFTMNVSVGDYNTSAVFYESDNITSYPSTNDVLNQLEYLIGYAPHIGNVTINNNTIIITTNCDVESLVTSKVVASITIDYDISCVSCGLTPTPTPTMTPTPTNAQPTPTPTGTPTPTPTSPLVYYVLGTCPSPKIYIIQSVLPVSGLVVGNYFAGNSIFDFESTVCYTVYDSSTSLSQLQSQYPNAVYPPPSNYFNSVVNSIFETCEDCTKAINIKSPINITKQCTVKYMINKICRTGCDVGYGKITSNDVNKLDINQQLPSGVISDTFNADIDSLVQIFFNVIPSDCGNINGVNIGVYDDLDNLVLPIVNTVETDENNNAYLSFILSEKICSQNITIKINEYCVTPTNNPPSIYISAANCISRGGCNDNSLCAVQMPVTITNAPVGYYVESFINSSSDATASYVSPYVLYTENNGLGSVTITLNLYDYYGGTVIATTTQTLSHNSSYPFLPSCE
jgi:hypothetical protein